MIVPLQGQEDHVSSAAAQIDALELRFLKLTLEREQVQKEIVTLRKQHKEALLLDAQRRCRIFATRFTNTLPLELREMVYTELWSGQKHRHDYPSEGEGITADPNYKSDPLKSVKRDKLWRLNCKGDSCQCFNWWDLSLWLQPKWVGRNVAQEAAKAYYRSLSKHTGGIRHANERLDVI
ncbi:hypothetical protein HBI13_106680 [Parastagonospora nodorum]|nr:hypothetical protein HBI13_106680 [Parastagonospora nodorum]KAH4105211.1 hypothetical protein HBH46_089910 [Parastagonospora nodorum]KAH4144454.1 hypothetical protein HBH45_026700 [Parastagonospora nodorum]KAH4159029.1 hypothetical protein HBH44_112360 [Parastagonospora nodorum]KAH4569814.1 hypothetical protein HBH84_122900 [Parastagonospora nodorum]